MGEIFKIWRDKTLREASEPGTVDFYMTPEEETNGQADYPSPSITSTGEVKYSSSKHGKPFLSFLPSPDDYKIEGPTHGKISHMIKHMWEFSDLQGIYMGKIDAFKKEVKEYIKSVDAGAEADGPLYIHDKRPSKNYEGNGITQKLSYKDAPAPGNGNAFDVDSGYRHPDTKNRIVGPSLSNTWDYLQDKYHLNPSDLNSTERMWLEKYVEPLTKQYDEFVDKHMKSALVLADYLGPNGKFKEGGKEAVQKAFLDGKPIKFKNYFEGKEKINYMNRYAWLVAQNPDGLVATMFVMGPKGKNNKSKTTPHTICGYLAGDGDKNLHIETKRFICAIDCPEVNGPRINSKTNEPERNKKDGSILYPKGKRAASLGAETYWDCEEEDCEEGDEECEERNRAREKESLEASSQVAVAADSEEAAGRQLANDAAEMAIDAAIAAYPAHVMVQAMGGYSMASKYARGAVSNALLNVLRFSGANRALTVWNPSTLANYARQYKAHSVALKALEYSPAMKVRFPEAHAAIQGALKKAPANTGRAVGMRGGRLGLVIAASIFLYSAAAAATTRPKVRREKQPFSSSSPTDGSCKGPMTAYGVRECGALGGPEMVASQIYSNIQQDHQIMTAACISMITAILRRKGLGHNKKRSIAGPSRRGWSEEEVEKYFTSSKLTLKDWLDQANAWSKKELLDPEYVLGDTVGEYGVPLFLDRICGKGCGVADLISHFRKHYKILEEMNDNYGHLQINDLLHSATGSGFYPSRKEILTFMRVEQVKESAQKKKMLMPHEWASNALNLIKKTAPAARSNLKSQQNIDVLEKAAAAKGQGSGEHVDERVVVSWLWDLSRQMKINKQIAVDRHEEIRNRGFKQAVRYCLRGGRASVERGDRKLTKVLERISSYNKVNTATGNTKDQLRAKAAAAAAARDRYIARRKKQMSLKESKGKSKIVIKIKKCT